MLLIGLTSMPSHIYAQGLAPATGGGSGGGASSGGGIVQDSLNDLESGVVSTGGLSTERDVSNILVTVINWVLGLAALLAVVALVASGVMYITALGNERQVDRAKEIIKYSVIGVLVMLLSFVIINTVASIFGGGP